MKGIIFDFNGTLFYDTPFHNTAWQRMVKELTGSDLDDDLRVKMHGKNNRDILHCINKNISDEDIISYSKRKEAIYRDICLENPDKLHLVNGAIELFNYLKEHNIPFTIASASIKENIDFFVKTFNLNRWFDLNKIVTQWIVHYLLIQKPWNFSLSIDKCIPLWHNRSIDHYRKCII